MVVDGVACFTRSERLRYVDAEWIESATEHDLGAWSSPPRLLFGTRSRTSWRPQAATTGINAIIGAWPGDETDEVIFRLLEELS